jgi:CubicO group peptidase (beta-lactamase class C family)
MKNIYSILMIVLFSIVSNANASEKEYPNEIKQIIDIINTELPPIMKKYNASGGSVVIANKEGTVWAKGFGQLSSTDTTPVNPETIFGVGSISKMFTATGAMFAAQDKLINLDVPIKKYLPNFTIKSRFPGNPMDQISMIDLLSHRAGLTHIAPIGNSFESTKSTEFDKHVESIQNTWLQFPVNQKACYSNLGFDLAGYILEKRSDMAFPEYMQKYVFNKLTGVCT